MGLNPADYTTSTLTTAQMVRDMVNATQGRFAPEVVLELLDNSNAPRAVIPDGTGGFHNVLTRLSTVLSCTWRKVGADDVVGSADLTLTGEAGNYLRPNQDRLWLKVAFRDRFNAVLHPGIPVGIYLVGIGDLDHWDRHQQYTMKLLDEGSVLTGLKFLNDFVPPQGVPVTTAIRALLMMDYRVPADGGRAPSGTVLSGSGGPQGTFPTPGSYAATGVLASSVCTPNPTTGLLDSPSGPLGVVSYNRYDAARCDPTTYAPISPVNGLPMTAVAGLSPAYFSDPGLALYFHPATGEFTLPFGVGATPVIMDPVPKPPQAYPAGKQVLQAAAVSPASNAMGNILPPLTTWPKDYDGSGPYATTTTAASVSVTSGSQAAPTTATVGSGTMGTRFGLGTTTVLPAGTYALGQSTSTTDPAHPATQWTQAVPATGTTGMILNAQNWSIPAGTWTLTALMTGLPYPQGTLSITCDVYKGATLLGTLASGGSGSFDGSYQSSFSVTCRGAMPLVTCGPSDTLRFNVKVAASAVTVTIGATDYSGGFNGSASVQFGAAPTVSAGGNYFNPGTPATTVTPTATGTNVPWPDANAAAILPSGCFNEGPDIPASRIAIPDLPDSIATTATANRNTTFMQEVIALASSAALTKPAPDETGIWRLAELPYSRSADVPAPVWTFSNASPRTDGAIILPLTQRIADFTSGYNVELVVSQANTSSAVVYSKRTNDLPNSVMSRVVTGRTIHDVTQDSSITTQAVADLVAGTKLQRGAEGTESLALETFCNPFLAVGDAVNVSFYDYEQTPPALVVDGTGNPYFVTAVETTMLDTQGRITGVSRLTLTRTVLL